MVVQQLGLQRRYRFRAYSCQPGRVVQRAQVRTAMQDSALGVLCFSG